MSDALKEGIEREAWKASWKYLHDYQQLFFSKGYIAGATKYADNHDELVAALKKIYAAKMACIGMGSIKKIIEAIDESELILQKAESND